jgi:hypothetical protein
MAEIWWRMNWEQRDLSWSLNFVTGIAVFLAQDLLGREHGFLARSLVLLDADFRSYTVAFRAISPTKFWGLLSLGRSTHVVPYLQCVCVPRHILAITANSKQD